jgi:hypothetical protein
VSRSNWKRLTEGCNYLPSRFISVENPDHGVLQRSSGPKPKVPVLSYLGIGSGDAPNPTGVAAVLFKQLMRQGRAGQARGGRNPFGVGHSPPLPQGSRVRQPWAGGRIPFGET